MGKLHHPLCSFQPAKQGCQMEKVFLRIQIKRSLATLSNYQNLLNLAVAKRYITEEEEQTLREWNVSPSTWTTEV